MESRSAGKVLHSKWPHYMITSDSGSTCSYVLTLIRGLMKEGGKQLFVLSEESKGFDGWRRARQTAAAIVGNVSLLSFVQCPKTCDINTRFL